MRILVTGAAGALGAATCRHLTARGHEVIGVDCRACSCGDWPAQVIDLRQPVGLEAMVADCDGVVHLANHTSDAAALPPQRLYLDNVTMNAHVFQAAVDAAVPRLIYASSVQVFAGGRYAPDTQQPSCLTYLPLDGLEPPRPGNAYAASKAAGEALLRYHAAHNAHMSCATVRWPQLSDDVRLRFYRQHRPAEAPAPGSMLDVGFSFLAMADAADFIGIVLEESKPGYAQWLPAAEQNRLGWTVARLCQAFYPDVPLRKPVDGGDGLVDLAPIRGRFNWHPRHSCLAGAVAT